MKGWIIPLIAGTALAVAAYTMGRSHAWHEAPPPMAQLHDVSWLKHELNLTESQQETLRELESLFGEQVIDLCAVHCAARNELAIQMLEGEWDAVSEEARVRRMGEAQMKSDLITMEHIRRVREALNPDQRNRYDQMVKATLTQACPHEMHHGGLKTDLAP